AIQGTLHQNRELEVVCVRVCPLPLASGVR
ncbi:MAG: hypothetical protein AVDCRST_MAG89-2572, partial [uncultured Gemmatimonadetes bacterium]